MNKRIMSLLAVALIVLLVAAPGFSQTKKLKNIGLYTFVKVRGAVPTAEVMKTLFEKYAADIKTGFDLAGCPEVYEPFMEQLKSAEFKDTKLAVG